MPLATVSTPPPSNGHPDRDDAAPPPRPPPDALQPAPPPTAWVGRAGESYVATLELHSGGRLHCSDAARDLWTASLALAEPFATLQDAQAVARRHGGFAEPLREAQRRERPAACAPPRRTALGPGQRCRRAGCGHARSAASEAHFSGNRRGAMGLGPCKVKGCLCPGFVA